MNENYERLGTPFSKIVILLSQPTLDWQIMRWHVRLFCGHIVEARRHYEMERPTDHGCSSEHCSECGMDPAVIVAYEPLGLAAEPATAPAAPRPRARSSWSKAELQAENARLRRSSDAYALGSLKPASRPDPDRAGTDRRRR